MSAGNVGIRASDEGRLKPIYDFQHRQLPLQDSGLEIGKARAFRQFDR